MFAAFVLLPFLTAFVGCFVPKKFGALYQIIYNLIMLGLLGFLVFPLYHDNANLVLDLNLGHRLLNGTLSLSFISIPFVVLMGLLQPLIIISAFDLSPKDIKMNTALLTLTQGILNIFFFSNNILVFYIAFEVSLLPMFAIILFYGAEDRYRAAFKFLLYTVFGSLLFMFAIAFLVRQVGNGDFGHIKTLLMSLDFGYQKMLWLMFFVAFAIKIPLVPFHTWLPVAHVQAPTSSSMMLAGIIIKIGGYGMIRVLLEMFPQKVGLFFQPYVMLLAGFAVIYGSMVAYFQSDIKKTIAYSSVAHMAYVVVGIFSYNIDGLRGAIFQMVSHGFVSAGLFYAFGVLYLQTHKRDIVAYGGLVSNMPRWSFLFVFLVMSSIGLPGTSGFIGEFMTTMAATKVFYPYGLLVLCGVVLSAVYMLNLVRRVVFGGSNVSLMDVNYKESIVLWIFVFLTLLLGIYPSLVTKSIPPKVLNEIIKLKT